MKNEPKTNPIMMPLIFSLTLGLAPFVPEPHIYKQYLNIVNGTFTEPIDWIDLVFHGFPWVWLIIATYKYIKNRKTKNA